MSTMLILRGISGTFGGKRYPNGALDGASAIAYAERLGYRGQVLDVSGETGVASAQTLKAVDAIRWDSDIDAIYGFSGGGYNARHVWGKLTAEERKRIRRIVVVGSPGVEGVSFVGCPNVTIVPDPPASKGGHMAGPRVLLESLPAPAPTKAPPPAPAVPTTQQRTWRDALRYYLGAPRT